MATAPRKARKRALRKYLPLGFIANPDEFKHVKAPKTPTPVVERSHTWRERFNKDRKRVELRPTRIGVARYGITDLGWQPTKKYLTGRGSLTKAAQS